MPNHRCLLGGRATVAGPPFIGGVNVSRSSSRRKRRRANQSSDSPGAQLALVERELDLRALQVKEAELAANDAALKQINAIESHFDQYNFIDAQEWRTDSFGQPIGSASLPDDRKDGRNSPFIMSTQDLANVRGMARRLTAESCPGVGVQVNLTNYTMGRGVTVTAGGKKSGVPDELIDKVQEAIEDFDELNDFTGDLDSEIFWRWRRDGEYFMALYPTADGRTNARIVEPELVTEPGGAAFSDEEISQRYGLHIPFATNWTFGLHTADHDVQTILGYHVEWSPGDSDYLPAQYMIHAKANVDRNIKRGLSDYYPVWQWFKRQEELLKNTAGGAAKMAAIAWIIQNPQGTTKKQATDMMSSNADYSWSRKLPGGGSREVTEKNYGEATTLSVPNGQQYLAGPGAAERGNAFIAVSQSILRYIATRWAMPEYMVSGDASNANFSSTVVAESPFVKNIETLQGKTGKQIRRIFWRVIENAFNAGRFQGLVSSIGELKRLVKLDVDLPEIQTRAPEMETQRRSQLHAAGILSKKTWATQEELDYEVEANNRKDEPQTTPAPGYSPGLGDPAALGGSEVGSLIESLGSNAIEFARGSTFGGYSLE